MKLRLRITRLRITRVWLWRVIDSHGMWYDGGHVRTHAEAVAVGLAALDAATVRR